MAHLTFSKLVVRSVLSKFATRLYPFEKREPYAATRGHIAIDTSLCIFCSLCQKKCPTHAITVNKPEKLWQIERMKCIQCGACVDICPKKCLTMERTYSPASTVKETESFRQEAKAAPAAESGQPQA
jgi:ech hydrogenase subunit F